MIYPDFFACPNWNYAKALSEHTRRVQFDSGWTRQRKRFPERDTKLNLEFVMKTEAFSRWATWWTHNAYDFFNIELEGVTETIRCISPMNYTYRPYDVITVTVTAERKPEATPQTVPVPIPPTDDRPDIPGTEIYCLEYSCSTFGDFFEGLGSIHYPYDQGGPTPSLGNNDVILGNGPVLTVQPNNDGNYGENVPEFPISNIDNCSGFMWGLFWDGFGTPTIHLAERTFLYSIFEGVTFGAILGQGQGWRFQADVVGIPGEYQTFNIYWGSDGVYVDSPVFSIYRFNHDMTSYVYPAVAAVIVKGPPLPQDPNRPSGTVYAYVNGVPVGTPYGPVPMNDINDVHTITVQAASSGAIAHAFIDGAAWVDQERWDEYIEALDRNRNDYEDDDPDCIPRPTGALVEGAVIPDTVIVDL